MLYSKKSWNIAYRPAGLKGNKASMHTTDGFIVTKNSKYKNEAVKFLKYLTSPEAEEMMMTYADLQPARKSLAQKYISETIPSKKGYNMKPFINAMPYATNAPLFLKQKRVGEILSPALANILYKDYVDTEATLKKITAQINAIGGVK
jgi:ABC-type glycerol-3-phosphate transport system substrate-binding protein